MKVTLELKFSSGNAAFDEPHVETSRILHELANNISAGGRYIAGDLVDVNGNTIGSFDFEVEEEEEYEELSSTHWAAQQDQDDEYINSVSDDS